MAYLAYAQICHCLYQLLTLKIEVQLTHALCGSVLGGLCTCTRERIYTTHVLVAVLRGSALCGLRQNIHKRSYF